MSLREQMQNGLLYVEFGHELAEDKEYEQVIATQRKQAKELVFDYNATRPSDYETKQQILLQLLGDIGSDAFIEAPIHFSYGCNTHIGHHFYANFNLTVVDDIDVYIGDYVMCAPNVTIAATGHPVYGEFRRKGAQFSLPVHIGNDVWIGANTVILPGVQIGNNVVIGAGSVVTRNIPDNCVAFGVPCHVSRKITAEDKKWLRTGVQLNYDWNR